MLAHTYPKAYHAQPNNTCCFIYTMSALVSGEVTHRFNALDATTIPRSNSSHCGRSIYCPSQSHMEFFTEVCNVRLSQIIKSFAVLTEILPHYDVFVETNAPLGEALQVMYGKALELDGAVAVSKSAAILLTAGDEQRAFGLAVDGGVKPELCCLSPAVSYLAAPSHSHL